MSESLLTTYTGLGADDVSQYESGISLALVQEEFDETSSVPSGNDLMAMYAYIIAGMSAGDFLTEGQCPVSFSGEGITVSLDFYVYVSDMDLDYELSASNGEIGEASLIVGEEEKQVIVPMDEAIDMTYNLERVSFVWDTLAYDEDGDAIQRPQYEIIGSHVVFEEKHFAVGRITTNFRAYKHTIRITAYYDPETGPPTYTHPITGADLTPQQAARLGIKVAIQANFNSTVTAKWEEDGKIRTTSLSLDIPGCVENSLGVCINDRGDGSTDTDNTSDKTGRAKVYYDFCNGDIYKVVD